MLISAPVPPSLALCLPAPWRGGSNSKARLLGPDACGGLEKWRGFACFMGWENGGSEKGHALPRP